MSPLVSLVVALALQGSDVPTAPAVTVTITPATLTLGLDHEAELRITAGGDAPADQPVPVPKVWTSVGKVEDLLRVGPRTFVARYLLPDQRFPQAAIIAAAFSETDHPLRGFTVVRIGAVASPAFRTDPKASVTLKVVQKEFGPEQADAEGNVRVPVVVPPGVPVGMARSVSASGATTEQAIDFKLPSFARILIAMPDTLVAGSTVELAVYAVEPAGTPVQAADVTLRASSGPKPQPLGGQSGEARFLVRVPRRLSNALTLEAELRSDPEVTAKQPLRPSPGPVTRLQLHPDRARLPVGQDSSMRVYLTATDAFGNDASTSPAAVLVDGRPLPVRSTEDGRTMAVVPAPPVYDGRHQLVVEAALASGYARQTIPLSNLPSAPRPGGSSAERSDRITLAPRLGVLWNRRAAGGAAFIEFLAKPAPSSRWTRWPRWLCAGFSAGVLASRFTVEDSTGLSEVSLGQVPFLALVRFAHRPHRRLALAAGLGAGLTWAQSQVRVYEHAITGHDWSPAASVDTEAAVSWGTGQLLAGVRYLHIELGRMSSGDRVLGNSAGLLIDLGYRWGW
jgi:hypothetical protein